MNSPSPVHPISSGPTSQTCLFSIYLTLAYSFMFQFVKWQSVRRMQRLSKLVSLMYLEKGGVVFQVRGTDAAMHVHLRDESFQVKCFLVS